MSMLECSNCGRVIDAGEEKSSGGGGTSGRWVSDGAQWEDDECRHCHFCLYDECEVYLRHGRWICAHCAELRNLQRVPE